MNQRNERHKTFKSLKVSNICQKSFCNNFERSCQTFGLAIFLRSEKASKLQKFDKKAPVNHSNMVHFLEAEMLPHSENEMTGIDV